MTRADRIVMTATKSALLLLSQDRQDWHLNNTSHANDNAKKAWLSCLQLLLWISVYSLLHIQQ